MVNNELIKTCEHFRTDLCAHREKLSTMTIGSYMLDKNNKVAGIRLMVNCDGPDIFINTFFKEIKGVYGDAEVTLCISNEISKEINEYFNGKI